MNLIPYTPLTEQEILFLRTAVQRTTLWLRMREALRALKEAQ